MDRTLSVVWFARRMQDAVPNPFQAARLVMSALDRLRAAGWSDDAIYDRRSAVASALRAHAAAAARLQAARVFRDGLRDGLIKIEPAPTAASPSLRTRRIGRFQPVAVLNNDHRIRARPVGVAQVHAQQGQFHRDIGCRRR